MNQMCVYGHVGRCVFLHLHPQEEAGRTQLSSDILCMGMEGLITGGDSSLVILGSQLEAV